MTANRLTPRHNNQPLFTIAVPTFNKAKFLKGCLDSALAQSFGDFELLVSDNASTDATQEVLAGFDDPRLRVERHCQNIGMSRNWNSCLNAARGCYVVFLSDDDRLKPQFLEQCADLVKRQDGLPIVVSLSDRHDHALGCVFGARKSAVLPTGIHSGHEVLLEFLRDNISVTISGIALRTNLLRERGGFLAELPYMDDVAAWAPLLLLGAAGFINESGTTFAHHAESDTARLSVEAQISDGEKIVNLLSQVADDYLLDEQIRRLVKHHARRCFARRALLTISDARRKGLSLVQVTKFVWLLRDSLKGVDPFYAVGFVGRILPPRFVADYLRRSKIRRSRLPSAHPAAAGRLALCAPAYPLAPDPLVATPLPAAPRPQPIAGGQR